MEIFELLKEEHDRIRELLAILMSEKSKSDAFEQARTQIETHMEGEEEHVYPEIREVGLKEEMLDSLQEHHIARIVLGELEDMSDREEAWAPKLKLFADLVDRHLRQEEHVVFPAARKKISRSRRQELEAEYRQFTSASARAGMSLPKSESPFYQGI